MHAGLRKLFLTALASAFAAMVVVYPSVCLSHTLDHLEAPGIGDPSGEQPRSNTADEELCGLCVSLAQGQAAVLTADPLIQVHAPSVSHRETVLLPQILSRMKHAPASPRAPPIH